MASFGVGWDISNTALNIFVSKLIPQLICCNFNTQLVLDVFVEQHIDCKIHL